jgi:Uma2 family endonuclease
LLAALDREIFTPGEPWESIAVMVRQATVERAAHVVEYPESDGRPMGETDFHITAILHLRDALRLHFRRTKNVYVAANLLLYYEEGDPKSFVVPDVFVVRGVSNGERRTYKVWEEQSVPSAVFEITSRSSRFEDVGTKHAIYEALGVVEYFLFDPLGEYLAPRLQGHRLQEGRYERLVPATDGTLRSQTLGLVLRGQGELLRLVDPTTNAPLPTLNEAVDVAATEATRAQAEATRADRAEAENARLRAELERLRRPR